MRNAIHCVCREKTNVLPKLSLYGMVHLEQLFRALSQSLPVVRPVVLGILVYFLESRNGGGICGEKGGQAESEML